MITRDDAGAVSLEEDIAYSFWLSVSCVLLISVFFVLHDDSNRGAEKHSDNPVSHVSDCLNSIDELLIDGVFAALMSTSTSGVSVHLSSDSVAELANVDQRVGQYIFSSTMASPLRYLAIFITLTGDEAIWMTLPLLLIGARVTAGIGPDILTPFSLEVLHDVLFCCGLEMVVKHVFKRSRPSYAKQSTFHVLRGEWFSFPSGHSMRAAYLVGRLIFDVELRARIVGAQFATSTATPWILAFWACCVAWSRIALGKHFPFDTAVGLMCGTIIALSMHHGESLAMFTFKLFTGQVALSEACMMVMHPEMRLEGFMVHMTFQAIYLLTVPISLSGLRYGVTFAIVLVVSAANIAISLHFIRQKRSDN